MTASAEKEINPEGDEPGKSRKKLEKEFNGAVGRAKAALFWERLWPKAAPPATVAGLFLTASWAGLWAALPPVGCIAGVAAFTAAFLGSPFLAKSRGSLRVTEDDALRRLDKNIGDPSRPAQTLRDKLSLANSPVSQEVFNAQLDRLWDKWGGKFKAGTPKPGLSVRSYLVIAAVALGAIITGIDAGEHRLDRIRDAFNWSAAPPAVAPLEVKAWVDPPENIDIEPLYLNEKTPGETAEGNTLVAHTSSTLTILTHDPAAKVYANGMELPLVKTLKTRTGGQEKTAYQYEVKLTDGNANILIEDAAGQRVEWNILVRPDLAPNVNVESVKPGGDNPNALGIEYKSEDDFGVKEGSIIIRPATSPDSGATPLPSGTLPPIPLPGGR